jgi:hypothetical protein
MVLKRSFAVREASLAVILKHFKAIIRNKIFFLKIPIAIPKKKYKKA